MNSIRYEYDHINRPGEEPTKCYIQECTNDFGSTAYVVTARPDNEGRNVASITSELGDSLVAAEQSQNPAYKPEALRLYGERPERGQDGEPRFAEYQAETTRTSESQATPESNQYGPRAEDWQWRDGNRMDKSDLEQRLGAEIETAPQRSQDKSLAEQNQEFKEMSFAFPRNDPPGPGGGGGEQVRPEPQETPRAAEAAPQQAPEPEPVRQAPTQQQEQEISRDR